MARTKGQVRVPQPVVPRQVTGISASPDDDQPNKADKTLQVAAESSKSSHVKDAPFVSKSKQFLVDYRELAAEEERHEDGPKIDKCPHCGAKFVDMPVWDYREHIMSCEADTNDAASDTSDLSDPPIDVSALPGLLSVKAVNGNRGDYEVESDDELPEPYEDYDASYPETVPLPDAEGDNDSEQEELQKVQLPAITDVNKFIISLEGMEEISFEKLYRRVTNAQQALVAWQNEWMDLESYTSDVQPFPPGSTEDFIIKHMEKSTKAKVPINPRLPKGFPVGGPEDDVKRAEFGVKHQDQLEASVYGYRWDHRAPKRGDQDPISQRIVESRPDGRDLRQRVPTQKATEGDLDTTPESDDENGKRRGRGQRVRYDSMGVDPDSGRGARQRYPSTRVDSISRDQTPVKTFASGKKIGRPRKNPIQTQQSQVKASASRLKELQAEFGLGSPYKNGNGYGGDDLDEDQDVPRQTTEFDSRPTSSSSMDSQLASRPGQDRSSGKGKKRSNTSDFEDALPSNKRIKSNGANGHDHSGGKDALGAEPNSRSVKMRTIQKESWAKDDGTRKSNLSNSMQERWAQAKKEGRKTLGPSTATAKKELSVTASTKSKKGTKVKGEGEPSAASLNMLNRWKKKREALAAGLTPPNIGRYAKAKSATSTTPVATLTPEQSNAAESKSSAIASDGSKIQREYTQGIYDYAGEGSSSVQAPATEGLSDVAPIKKRGGRPKKIVYSDSGPSQFDISGPPAEEGMGLLDTNSHEAIQDNAVDEGDNHDFPTTGKRGGRRKKAEGVLSSTEPSSSQTQPSSGSVPIRASTRVRKPTSRQASAAESTQPSTRQSSRVSGHTVTPTPAPVYGIGPQMNVKQEPTHNIAMPKTRRGAKSTGESESYSTVDSAMQEPGKRKRSGIAAPILPSTEFPDAMEFGEEGTDGEHATRRRRGGRSKRDNAATSPAPSDFQTPSERPIPRGKGGRFTQSSSSSSTSGGAIVVEDKVPAHGVVEGPPNKRRRGGQSADVTEGLPAEGERKGKGKIRLTLGSKKVSEGEPADVEALPTTPLDPAEAAALAARKAKSEKMSQIMKARWSRGDMAAVMEQKKANNRARKAAEGAASGFTPPALTVFTGVVPAPTTNANGFIAPPPKVRKPTGAAAHKRNQKKLTDPDVFASPGNITTTTITAPARKKSEYEVYQDLMSPIGASSSPAGRRAPRTAALKAQQSFSSLNDDENDDEPEEDEQVQIEKQLQIDNAAGTPSGAGTIGNKDLTDYERFQALTSPVPGVVLGKRKRKPVMNLTEAMRIEMGEEDEEEEEEEEE